MRNPRKVDWAVAQLKYDRVPLQDKYFKGEGFLDGSNWPRGLVLDKLARMRRDRIRKESESLEVIQLRVRERLRGLLRGE